MCRCVCFFLCALHSARTRLFVRTWAPRPRDECAVRGVADPRGIACYVVLQAQLQELVEKNFYLNRSAKEAYRSYILAYASHSLKNMFNVHKLDLQAVAKGFGFTNPPRVNLNLKVRLGVPRGVGGARRCAV